MTDVDPAAVVEEPLDDLADATPVGDLGVEPVVEPEAANDPALAAARDASPGAVAAAVRKVERAKADRAVHDVRSALEGQIAHLSQRIEALTPKPAPPAEGVAAVGEDEARQYATRFQLYAPGGALDTDTAKVIIAENRSDMRRAAAEAAQRAVAPLQGSVHEHGRREQLTRVAMIGRAEGWLDEPTQQALVQKFVDMPPELAALPQVADLILNATYGERKRPKGARVTPPERDPVFTEPAGGRGGQTFQASARERQIMEARGITEKDWQKDAAGYQPGGPNEL